MLEGDLIDYDIVQGFVIVKIGQEYKSAIIQNNKIISLQDIYQVDQLTAQQVNQPTNQLIAQQATISTKQQDSKQDNQQDNEQIERVGQHIYHHSGMIYRFQNSSRSL
jgi:hypothetical protein